jgi:hypothetical protein
MKLLISIVNTQEAAAAIAGGTDILDIKNPLEGALGANFPHVIQAVRQQTPKEMPVSVALGDAPNKPGTTALAALGAACCDVEFIKVGLYGTRTTDQAITLLKAVCRAVRDHSPETKIIAAAYADAHIIGAFPVLEAPMVAAKAGADGCMLDTAGKKNNETLFTHLKDESLKDFIGQCRDKGLISALAGSLGKSDIPRIASLGPDILGFRGAACDGDRVNGRVRSSLVRTLKTLVTGSDDCLR